MARIDELPPDQRAALQLLLKQGRSYDEIAQLLRIEPSAVRERARAALDALGPDDVDGLSLERQDEVADYLLGQQTASLRASTRMFLEESAPGRAWARVVAGELRPMAGNNLPEIPAEAAEVDEAFDALSARTAHRERTEKSSRVGGAILLVGLALALLLAILLITGAFSGDDDDGGSASTGTQTTSTQNQRAVALVAQGLPRATQNRFYAIWLYTSPQKAKFLGFPNPQPDQNGRIETGFGLPNDANQYERLVVTRETQERPRQPGTIVLSGALDLPG
jgi:hypothetical protein